MEKPGFWFSHPMNLFLQPRSQPLVIAHRGSSAHTPENTLAAFQLAAEQGADAIELDVDLTRDGHAIVLHDATLDRTTDGSGAVHELTLEEIRRLDAGMWKSAAFKGERVPLLAEVFAAVGQRVLINVEVKSMSLRSNGVEAKVAALVQQHDLFERVIVSSFNPFALRRIKQIEPRLACGLLYAPDLPIVLRQAWLAPLIPHLDARHPHHSQVKASVVEQWHARGQRVNVWTVNDAATLHAMVLAGVDGIIGDDPAMLCRVLNG
jgi:glycerophosphoryl diester phosphodiesterase